MLFLDIAPNPLFPKEKTKWSFMIIAKDYNEYVDFRLKNAATKGRGNFYNSEDGNVSISIKRWSELILENKLKYGFLKEKLAYKIEDDIEGMSYIKNRYSQYFNEE